MTQRPHIIQSIIKGTREPASLAEAFDAAFALFAVAQALGMFKERNEALAQLRQAFLLLDDFVGGREEHFEIDPSDLTAPELMKHYAGLLRAHIEIIFAELADKGLLVREPLLGVSN